MPSTLKNLFFWKTMDWKTFGTPKSKPAPTASHRRPGANTHARWKFSTAPKEEKIPGTKLYRLKDNVGVTIDFDKGKSWVATWVFDPSRKQFQKDLLHHEIGHYKICALIARDLFIEIMQLKSKQYSSLAAISKDINGIINRHHNEKVIQKIHDKYDETSEADHGLNAGGQKRWDGYFNKAFTQARVPHQTTPGGTTYKVPLLEILGKAGKI